MLGVLLIVIVFVVVMVGVEDIRKDDYSYSFGFPTWGDYWGGGGPLKGGRYRWGYRGYGWLPHRSMYWWGGRRRFPRLL